MNCTLLTILSIVLTTALVVTGEGCDPLACSEPTVTGQKEEVCSSVHAFLECQAQVIQACGLDGKTMEPFKEELRKMGCDSAGNLIPSLMYVFLGMVLFKLID